MEEIHDDGSPTEKTFEHVPTEIGAEEAEEVELILKILTILRILHLQLGTETISIFLHRLVSSIC